MRKILVLLLITLGITGFSAPYKDERGVTLMEVKEWEKFYNLPGEEDELCIMIGSLIMEKSYIEEGKKMGHTLKENQEATKNLNSILAEESGAKDINGRIDGLHEYYYGAFCKMPTQEEFDLIGSPVFRKEMERIFKTYSQVK